MDANKRSLWSSLAEFVGSLGAQVRAALAVGVKATPDLGGDEPAVDPEFEGWLRNDPMVTAGSASRYRSQPPGYLARNGRGSLEVGAVDD